MNCEDAGLAYDAASIFVRGIPVNNSAEVYKTPSSSASSSAPQHHATQQSTTISPTTSTSIWDQIQGMASIDDVCLALRSPESELNKKLQHASSKARTCDLRIMRPTRCRLRHSRKRFLRKHNGVKLLCSQTRRSILRNEVLQCGQMRRPRMGPRIFRYCKTKQVPIPAGL